MNTKIKQEKKMMEQQQMMGHLTFQQINIVKLEYMCGWKDKIQIV